MNNSKLAKFMSFISLIIILLGGTLSFAEDYYSILKRQYRAADQAIADSDFERPGFPLARICVEISADRPMTETYVMINKYTRISEGQGPLLPKTTVTKIIFRPYNSDVFGGSLFDQISTEFTADQVTSTQDDGLGKVIATVNIRKSGDNLLFEREYIAGEDLTKTNYGYCFHRETKN